MSGFKMFQDRVAGVCHGCANLHVKVTESNQTIATCTAGVNRNRRPVQITEPLAFCTDREPIEMTVEHLPEWMQNLAWTPVVIKPGKKARGSSDFIKSFIPKQETPPGMFDAWQEHTTRAQQEEQEREHEQEMARMRERDEKELSTQQVLAAVLEHLAKKQ